MMKRLAMMAVGRLARDPHVRDKVRDLASNRAKPALKRKTSAAKQEVHNAEPGSSPTQTAGKAIKRFLTG